MNITGIEMAHIQSFKMVASDKICARIYFLDNDDDLLTTRSRSRKHKQLLGEVFKLLRAAQAFDGPDPKVRYSSTAGCPCGCSPGFIVERDTLLQDVIVTVDSTAA